MLRFSHVIGDAGFIRLQNSIVVIAEMAAGNSGAPRNVNADGVVAEMTSNDAALSSDDRAILPVFKFAGLKPVSFRAPYAVVYSGITARGVTGEFQAEEVPASAAVLKEARLVGGKNAAVPIRSSVEYRRVGHVKGSDGHIVLPICIDRAAEIIISGVQSNDAAAVGQGGNGSLEYVLVVFAGTDVVCGAAGAYRQNHCGLDYRFSVHHVHHFASVDILKGQAMVAVNIRYTNCGADSGDTDGGNGGIHRVDVPVAVFTDKGRLAAGADPRILVVSGFHSFQVRLVLRMGGFRAADSALAAVTLTLCSS